MTEPNPLPLSCPDCAAQMPETAAFCPGCGRQMAKKIESRWKVGIFPENVAGAVAYLTFVPAVVFLLLDPYKKNRYARFHSVQCLLVWLVGVIAAALVKLGGYIVSLIPVAGPLLLALAWMALILAAGILWLVLEVKAFQGEFFKLPVLGELAERYASPME